MNHDADDRHANATGIPPNLIWNQPTAFDPVDWDYYYYVVRLAAGRSLLTAELCRQQTADSCTRMYVGSS